MDSRHVTVSLDEEQAAFVDSQIEHGAFENESAVMREGVKRMQEHHERLKAEIKKGIDDVEAGRAYEYRTVGEFSKAVMARYEALKR